MLFVADGVCAAQEQWMAGTLRALRKPESRASPLHSFYERDFDITMGSLEHTGELHHILNTCGDASWQLTGNALRLLREERQEVGRVAATVSPKPKILAVTNFELCNGPIGPGPSLAPSPHSARASGLRSPSSWGSASKSTRAH